MKTYKDAQSAVMLYGVDIIASAGMQTEKQYIQHGRVSVYEHSVNVACLGLFLAALLHIRINKRALAQAANNIQIPRPVYDTLCMKNDLSALAGGKKCHNKETR